MNVWHNQDAAKINLEAMRSPNPKSCIIGHTVNAVTYAVPLGLVSALVEQLFGAALFTHPQLDNPVSAQAHVPCETAAKNGNQGQSRGIVLW